jgi:hypothetical protein
MGSGKTNLIAFLELDPGFLVPQETSRKSHHAVTSDLGIAGVSRQAKYQPSSDSV